jgi:membrane protein
MAGSVFARARTRTSSILAGIRDHNLTLVAAGAAFYGFLAAVPALIAIVSVYGLIENPNDVRTSVDNIASALPREVQHFVEFQLKAIIRAGSTEVSATLIVAIAIALWSASGGVAALVSGIRIADGQPPLRGFFGKRARALVLTLMAVVVISLLLFVVAFLPPIIDNFAGKNGTTIIDVLRWPVLAALMAVGIGVLFRVATGRGARGWFGIVTVGTVVATLGALLLSFLFSIYTAQFATYSRTYGALATIVVVLLWLFLSAFAVLVGAVVDATTSDATTSDATR